MFAIIRTDGKQYRVAQGETIRLARIRAEPGDAFETDLLVLVGNVNANPVVNLFNASFTPDVFHNFGITLDFDAKYVAFSATLSSPGVMVLTLPTAQPQSSTPPTPRPSQLSTAPSRTTSAAKVNTTSAR